MAKKNVHLKAAKKCIEELFLSPPFSQADIESRLSSVDATSARRLLVDQLDKGRISEANGFIFLGAMSMLGPGRQKNRLMKIAGDTKRGKDLRAYAFMAIGLDNPEDSAELFTGIGDDLLDEIVGFSLHNLFMMGEDEIGPAVAEFFGQLPNADAGPNLLKLMEEQRLLARVPAYIAYAAALSDESLSGLHPAMIGIIEEEGNPLGTSLLEELGSKTQDRSAQRDFQKAALKARTKAAAPKHDDERHDGFALASTCDGQGAVVVMTVLENKDGSRSAAQVCFRVENEVRDGFYHSHLDVGEFDELIEQYRMGADIEFVKVPIIDAAKHVYTALEETRKKDIPIDLETQRAISCFPHPSGSLDAGMQESYLPFNYSMDMLEELLAQPDYQSWFFDLGDFENAGLSIPDEDLSDEWINEAAEKLDAPAIKERLLAMTRYMSWWCQRNDEQDNANMLLAINKSITDNFKNNDFIKTLIIKSFLISKMAEQQDDESLNQVGDPQTRLYLKSLFFSELKEPKGKDLAVLDFTEAAYVAMDDVFEVLPGELYPRTAIAPVIAHEVAKLVVKSLITKTKEPVDKLLLKTARAVKKVGGYNKKDSEVIAERMLYFLTGFAQNICGYCQVACLHHPRKKMSGVFFGSDHPSLL